MFPIIFEHLLHVRYSSRGGRKHGSVDLAVAEEKIIYLGFEKKTFSSYENCANGMEEEMLPSQKLGPPPLTS